ncbi:hypothetical protein H0I76_11485 [Limibaculum sp. M0105]|uniref:Uncharacterized protein n=1 Tax=Thermohalobaculum xanthum TaxID=2753746 RepID=A0A8J7M770_9RHOB|nr:hypothetical protein [Thermohalobaculum xanthum]MBK0399814.1 hypothetical protein [Thermohalobaculum xanthum]
MNDPYRELAEKLYALNGFPLPDEDADVPRDFTIKATPQMLANWANALGVVCQHLLTNSAVFRDFPNLADPLHQLMAKLSNEVVRDRSRRAGVGRPRYDGNALQIRTLALAWETLLAELGMARRDAATMVVDALNEGGITTSKTSLKNWRHKWLEEGDESADGSVSRKQRYHDTLERLAEGHTDLSDAIGKCRAMIVSIALSNSG